MALAGMATATEQAGSFTQATNNNQGGYAGFTFNLSADWLTASPAEIEEYTAFELTSITLQGAETWFRLYNANNDSGLVILDNSNAVVGKSNWDPSIGSATSVGGKNSYPLTYSFLTTTVVGETSTTTSSLTLDLDTDYKVVIYGNKTAFDNLTVGTTLTSLAGSENPNETAPIVAAGLRLDYNASNTTGVMIGSGGAADATAFPTVSFSGQLVPEPTTATLSLLALAGLAARRRRK